MTHDSSPQDKYEMYLDDVRAIERRFAADSALAPTPEPIDRKEWPYVVTVESRDGTVIEVKLANDRKSARRVFCGAVATWGLRGAGITDPTFMDFLAFQDAMQKALCFDLEPRKNTEDEDHSLLIEYKNGKCVEIYLSIELDVHPAYHKVMQLDKQWVDSLKACGEANGSEREVQHLLAEARREYDSLGLCERCHLRPVDKSLGGPSCGPCIDETTEYLNAGVERPQEAGIDASGDSDEKGQP